MRVIDRAMPHPNKEDVEEKEYTVDMYIPVLIQVGVYAHDEEEAEEQAIEAIKHGRVPFKTLDKDYDEAVIECVEEQ